MQKRREVVRLDKVHCIANDEARQVLVTLSLSEVNYVQCIEKARIYEVCGKVHSTAIDEREQVRVPVG